MTGEIEAPEGYADLVEIGRGSQAVVYRATKMGIGKSVALKAFRLPATGGGNPHVEREVQSLLRLDGHPNVVGVHDLRRTSDRLWLETDLCTGGSVARWIATHHPDASADDRLTTAIRYATMAAQALRYAHRNGIIHRDIKPANLLIDHHDVVRLADFGVADVVESIAAAAGGPTWVGTPRYRAPELDLGQPPTPASDVFALGVTIRALRAAAVPDDQLAGADGDTVTGDGPPAAAEIAAALDELAARMRADQPAARPGLDEVIEHLTALQSWLEEPRPAPVRELQPPTTVPTTHTPTVSHAILRHRRVLTSSAALLVFVAAVGAAWTLQRDAGAEVASAGTDQEVMPTPTGPQSPTTMALTTTSAARPHRPLPPGTIDGTNRRETDSPTDGATEHRTQAPQETSDPSPQQPQPPATLQIQSLFASKCVDVRGPLKDDGTPLQLWDCINVPEERWRWDGKRLRGFGNKCIDVQGPSAANGTPVQLWTCENVSQQKWTLTSSGELRGYGGKCLDVRGPESENGTPLQIWDCEGVAQQSWRFF
jgi:serine/threonine protein kinase